MSEPIISMPSGFTTFEIVGPTGPCRFSLDLVEAACKINELATEYEGKNNYEHLGALAAWVKEKGGPLLNKTQADWFWEHVTLETNRSKKAYLEELASLTSTGSTPSD